MPKIILEELLKKNGLTKYEFAKRLNTRYTDIFRFFRKKPKPYDPKFSMLVRWSKAIGCSVKDLISD